MDAIDRQILDLLQRDATRSIAEVAEKGRLVPDAMLEANPAS